LAHKKLLEEFGLSDIRKVDDEIGRLATSFNQMADELKRARNELTQWAQTLEGRVAQKTEELRRAHANMVQMEKMVSLGKLASTVAMNSTILSKEC